jgi:hypothetical protein
VHHKRTKHIAVKYHYVRRAQEDGTVNVVKVHTDHNHAGGWHGGGPGGPGCGRGPNLPGGGRFGRYTRRKIKVVAPTQRDEGGGRRTTIKLLLADIARPAHLAYWSARAVEMDNIDQCMIDVGAAYAAEEYEAGRLLPEIWTARYWRLVGAAVTENRHGRGGMGADELLVAQIRAFALVHLTVVAHGGPFEVEYASTRMNYVARQAATACANHVQWEGLFSAIRALIRTALETASVEEQRAACRVDRRIAPEEDAGEEEEDEGDERPSRTALKAACERLTRAVWRGNVADDRLPYEVRGANLLPLLPSFSVAPGLNIGYYLVQQRHVRESYESMLRLLEAVQALTPPDQEGERHGPKRFPEKAR